MLALGAGLLPPAAAIGPAFSVTLTATPDPTDPLQVAFSAAAVTGVPTGFNWSFGDGHYLNGSSSAYAAPVHRYAGPGNYTVTVVVLEGTATSSQSMPLLVHPAPLAVGIEVSNVTGTLPRTVTFTAVIGGGTGTFRSVDWTFGDGGSGVGTTIQYSYVQAGHFHVALQVTDSSGAVASASLWENVSAPPSGPVSFTTSTALLTATGAGAMIVGVVAGVLFGRWARERASRGPKETVAAGPRSEGEPEGPVPATAPPPPALEGAAGSKAPSTRAAETPSPKSAAEVPATVARAEAPVPAVAPSGLAAPGRTALFLSQRIVLHLAQLGTLGPAEVAPVGFSQLGISQALKVRQNALTNVLRRLVAAGALTEDVRHVRGQPRRLKVYRLSARGESLAHDLRAQGLSLEGGDRTLRTDASDRAGDGRSGEP